MDENPRAKLKRTEIQLNHDDTEFVYFVNDTKKLSHIKEHDLQNVTATNYLYWLTKFTIINKALTIIRLNVCLLASPPKKPEEG